jgi:hypothetical protein
MRVYITLVYVKITRGRVFWTLSVLAKISPIKPPPLPHHGSTPEAF